MESILLAMSRWIGLMKYRIKEFRTVDKEVMQSGYKTTCSCGRELGYVSSPYIESEKRACTCGKVHNIIWNPIDWDKVAKGNSIQSSR